MSDIYTEILKMRASGQEGVLVTVVDKKGSGPSRVGGKLLLLANGERFGTVGGGELESLALQKATELLTSRSHHLQVLALSGGCHAQGVASTNMQCGGTVTLFFEFLPLSPTIYVFGSGHVGRALLWFLQKLDYQTVLVEANAAANATEIMANQVLAGDYLGVIKQEAIPPASYVVIAGYSHEEDYIILKAICEAGWKPRYIGLLASAAKGKAIISRLQEELGPDLDLSMLYYPVGLDIGGKTPHEIALSIVAEIQALRYHKNQNKHLSR